MPDELLDGVYDITVRPEPQRFRAYLIDRDVPTLFDTGFADTTEHLISEIDSTGIEPERLIVTHEDGDHTGGFRDIVERYEPETWVPADDAAAIEADSGLEADHQYRDGDEIGPYEAVHAPGHTPGCSVLVDEAASLAVTGDVVIGADLRGLPAGYLIPPAEVFTDDPAQAERSLENLLDYEFEAALVYHGTAVLEGASDRLREYVEFPGKPSPE